VLLVLADCARDDGTVPAANGPGFAYIARRAGYQGQSHIAEIMARLEDLGELHVIRASKNGRRHGYRVNLALFAERAAVDPKANGEVRRIIESIRTSHESAPVPTGDQCPQVTSPSDTPNQSHLGTGTSRIWDTDPSSSRRGSGGEQTTPPGGSSVAPQRQTRTPAAATNGRRPPRLLLRGTPEAVPPLPTDLDHLRAIANAPCFKGIAPAFHCLPCIDEDEVTWKPGEEDTSWRRRAARLLAQDRLRQLGEEPDPQATEPSPEWVRSFIPEGCHVG